MAVSAASPTATIAIVYTLAMSIGSVRKTPTTVTTNWHQSTWFLRTDKIFGVLSKRDSSGNKIVCLLDERKVVKLINWRLVRSHAMEASNERTTWFKMSS